MAYPDPLISDNLLSFFFSNCYFLLYCIYRYGGYLRNITKVFNAENTEVVMKKFGLFYVELTVLLSITKLGMPMFNYYF